MVISSPAENVHAGFQRRRRALIAAKRASMPTAKLLRDCAVPLPPSIQSPQTAKSVTPGTSSSTATTARKRRGGRASATAASSDGVCLAERAEIGLTVVLPPLG